MSNTLLSDLPDVVRESALLIAQQSDERVVGYKAITEPDGPGRVKPVRWLIITEGLRLSSNGGYYEVQPDGVCVRSAVLHRFV